MIHFTQGNRSVIAAILFLILNTQHNIQTYGELRHGSTSSRHSTNEGEVSTSRSKAIEMVGNGIRHSGQKNVTKGKGFRTRTKKKLTQYILSHKIYAVHERKETDNTQTRNARKHGIEETSNNHGRKGKHYKY